jgi:RecA-family ATPase
MDGDAGRKNWAPPPENEERGAKFGRLTVFSVDDVDTARPRDYLLKGIISRGEMSLWVGPPKCGKSFLMLHIAYLLSLGRSVFGLRVKPTKVLYVAAEGEGGIVNRIKALRDKYGPSPNIHFIAQPADLLHDTGHKNDLLLAIKACDADLVLLDTLSRLMAGGDENSPQDMGTFVRNVSELIHETGAHIAVVHHGTKANNGSGSNPRGHSSLTGADDCLVEVTKHEDGTRTARIVHAKDDVDGRSFGFQLEQMNLGIDDDGDPITTLLVAEDAKTSAERNKQASLTDNEKIALRTLDQAFKADAILAIVGDDDRERPVVRLSDWRSWFYREGLPGEDQDTKKKAFQRVRNSLLAKGRIATRDDFVWRPEVW